MTVLDKLHKDILQAGMELSILVQRLRVIGTRTDRRDAEQAKDTLAKWDLAVRNAYKEVT